VFPPEHEHTYLVWLAVANSWLMDYVVRKKVSLTMSYTVLDSLPFPRLPADDTRMPRIAALVLRLLCTGPEMTDFWNRMASCGWVEPTADRGLVPGFNDSEERLTARAELDAIVARDIYGLDRADMELILDSFPTAAKYERQRYGSFRSRDLILEKMS
jgi:hypothetical protein